MSDPRSDDRRNDRGSVMVVAALAMVALVLFAALAIDVGFIWSSRTQSQNVSDSAAIAAAQTMIVPDPATGPMALKFDEVGATNKGIEYAGLNSTVANPSAVVQPTDFEFGFWNLDTRTLEPGDPTNPDSMTAVRVDMRMDGTDNKRSPGLLSRLLKASDGSRPFMQGFEVNNTAVAYLGYAGHFDPDFFDLPIALDSCELTSNGGCGSDFCERAQAASTCPLVRTQANTNGIFCGEFSATVEQNMCWVNFSDSDKSLAPKELDDIIDDGHPEEVDVGDKTYVDNGDKTDVVDYLRDAFYGCKDGGGPGTPPDARGTDEYGSGFIDSWVVKLPVIECQDETQCAGGDPAAIVGGVCFEIREIIAPAPGPGVNCKFGHTPPSGKSRLIKGRPLCPNSTDPKVQELYEEHCMLEPPDGSVEPGGCGFGFRANRVVLVE
jgi:Putative Flp pilus-assembly TadE/G-like